MGNFGTIGGTRVSGAWLSAIATLLLLLVLSSIDSPVSAQNRVAADPAIPETRAGTAIPNVATLSLRDEQGESTLRSNTVTLLVAERLDVALERRDTAPILVVPGGTAVPLTLTNRGNGREAFSLSSALSDASAKVRLIAIDRDGDGRFDAAIDTILSDARTPLLEPGEVLPLLVLVDPAAANVTAVSLTVVARASTGDGLTGTMFATRGDGGADAVTGKTNAIAEVVVPVGTGVDAAPSLVKSQSVRAPDGSSTPVAGAVVTYRLEARFPGPAPQVRVDDPIPQGTAYVPGSLTLDAVRLSDGADDDAGSADANAVAVTLGDIAGATIRTIQFQVIIQ